MKNFINNSTDTVNFEKMTKKSNGETGRKKNKENKTVRGGVR